MFAEDPISAAVDHQASLPDAKRADLQALVEFVAAILPDGKRWFDDGRDDSGKVVSNPTVGFGAFTIRYANGSSKEFFQIGVSANTAGISVYLLGIPDKAHLARTYGATIGKATVTGYCIKFKKLKDIHLDVLEAAIRDGVAMSANA